MRSIKVFTHVDRINWFFSKWIIYHQKYFQNNEFLFIIDNQFISEEEITSKLLSHGFYPEDIQIVSFGNIPQDYYSRMAYARPFVNSLQKKLLSNSEVVIYLDIDELLYHSDLRNLLNTFTDDFLVTNVVDVTHRISAEPDFDFNRSVFSQRRYMNVSETSGWYIKPIITRVPVNWGDGRHTIDGLGYSPKPQDLFIIHLGKVDFEFCNKLAKENISMRGKDETHYTFVDDRLKYYISSLQTQMIPENFLSLDI